MADHQLTFDTTTNIQDDLENIIQTPLYRELNMGDTKKGFLLKSCKYCVQLHESFISTLHLIHAHFIVQKDENHFVCFDKPCTKLCFFKAEDLYEHWKSGHFTPGNTSPSHPKPYYCNHQSLTDHQICNRYFSQFIDFKIHQLCHISDRKIVHCLLDKCERAFFTVEELQHHIRHDHRPAGALSLPT